jgi:putative CocE/NonD family hydrolase
MREAVTSRVVVERDVVIEMRDGVVLRADVYRPAGDEPVPALIERTPYSKSNGRYVGGLLFNPLDAAQRGYAIVVQDVRGRFSSGGEWEPFVNESADGHDTIDWAAEQPWCNGSVGVYGASYMGTTALQAAVGAPSSLRAALVYMTGSNYWNEWTYSGGAFELKFNLVWTLRSLVPDRLRRLDDPAERKRLLDAHADQATDMTTLSRSLPLDDLAAFRVGAPYWRTWHQHGTYDEYWQAVDVNRRVDELRAPVLHVSGWYDHFLRGHLDLYRALEDHGVEQRLILGPWDHGSYHSTSPTMSGERDFGPRAVNGPALMSDVALTWFDRWLGGGREDEEPAPKVRYFVMGENRWHDAEEWPPAHEPVPWYFRAGAELSTEPPLDEQPDHYVYDPRDPVPSVGGRGSTSVLGAAGVQDQSAVASRDDVVSYTSSELASPLTIAGPVSIRLHASASTPSTDFAAKLVDVQPDGYCANLADGILRVVSLEPGETLVVDIDLWAVAHTFGVGHRVRIEITGGSFPRWDRNPNTGMASATALESELQPSTHVVFHDDARRSCAVLPVLTRR